jgi:hypothetical protein
MSIEEMKDFCVKTMVLYHEEPIQDKNRFQPNNMYSRTIWMPTVRSVYEMAMKLTPQFDFIATKEDPERRNGARDQFERMLSEFRYMHPRCK